MDVSEHVVYFTYIAHIGKNISGNFWRALVLDSGTSYGLSD